MNMQKRKRKRNQNYGKAKKGNKIEFKNEYSVVNQERTSAMSETDSIDQ